MAESGRGLRGFWNRLTSAPADGTGELRVNAALKGVVISLKGQQTEQFVDAMELAVLLLGLMSEGWNPPPALVTNGGIKLTGHPVAFSAAEAAGLESCLQRKNEVHRFHSGTAHFLLAVQEVAREGAFVLSQPRDFDPHTLELVRAFVQALSDIRGSPLDRYAQTAESALTHVQRFIQQHGSLDDFLALPQQQRIDYVQALDCTAHETAAERAGCHVVRGWLSVLARRNPRIEAFISTELKYLIDTGTRLNSAATAAAGAASGPRSTKAHTSSASSWTEMRLADGETWEGRPGQDVFRKVIVTRPDGTEEEDVIRTNPRRD